MLEKIVAHTYVRITTHSKKCTKRLKKIVFADFVALMRLFLLRLKMKLFTQKYLTIYLYYKEQTCPSLTLAVI